MEHVVKSDVLDVGILGVSSGANCGEAYSSDATGAERYMLGMESLLMIIPSYFPASCITLQPLLSGMLLFLLSLSLYFQWVHNSKYIVATVDPLLSPYSMMMTIIIIITVFGVTDRVGGESSFPPLTVSPCATGRQEPEHGCRRGSEIKQVGLPVAALPLPLTVSPPCVRREAGSVACVQEEGRPVPAASL